MPPKTSRKGAYTYPYVEWHAAMAKGRHAAFASHKIEGGRLVIMVNELGMQSGWESWTKRR
jgi:hypothetical protein